MSFKSILAFSLLVGASAFKFQPLGLVSPGSTSDVRWTSSPEDPKNIALGINCIKEWTGILVPSTSTDLHSYAIYVPGWISPTVLSKFNIRCSLEALDSPKPSGKLLDSAAIIFATSSSPGISNTPQPTTGAENSPTIIQTLSTMKSVTSSSPTSLQPTSSETPPDSKTNPEGSGSTLSAEANSAPTMGFSRETNDRSFPSFSSSTSMPGTMNPMGSPSSLPGEPDEPGEGVEQPIGAIVGGVLGGVFSLAVIVAAILYCRRKRRSSSDLLWTTRDNNASPSPSLEEDWDSKAAMHEDISGTTSAPPNYDYHDAIGRQDTNMTENKNWTSGKTKEEEFESEQERRREEIYERMRRVLDNDSNTLDSNTLHK